MARITNDCIRQDNPLTFELNGKCYSFDELLDCCDNSEVLILLNKILSNQSPTIIKVPERIIEYIEIRTIEYRNLPCGRKLPEDKVIRLDPTRTKPQRVFGDPTDWIRVNGVSGWWYKASRFDRYYFSVQPRKKNWWGLGTAVISEDEFYDKFPYQRGRKFLRTNDNGIKRDREVKQKDITKGQLEDIIGKPYIAPPTEFYRNGVKLDTSKPKSITTFTNIHRKK